MKWSLEGRTGPFLGTEILLLILSFLFPSCWFWRSSELRCELLMKRPRGAHQKRHSELRTPTAHSHRESRSPGPPATSNGVLPATSELRRRLWALEGLAALLDTVSLCRGPANPWPDSWATGTARYQVCNCLRPLSHKAQNRRMSVKKKYLLKCHRNSLWRKFWRAAKGCEAGSAFIKCLVSPGGHFTGQHFCGRANLAY